MEISKVYDHTEDGRNPAPRPGGAAAAALCAVSLRGSSRGALGHQAGARARR